MRFPFRNAASSSVIASVKGRHRQIFHSCGKPSGHVSGGGLFSLFDFCQSVQRDAVKDSRFVLSHPRQGPSRPDKRPQRFSIQHSCPARCSLSWEYHSHDAPGDKD